jgi:hypothetical protein
MITSPTDIALCIVPVFVIIAAIGIYLFVRRNDDDDTAS